MNSEVICIFSNSQTVWHKIDIINRRDFYDLPFHGGKNGHPAAKSVEICSDLINRLSTGLVLDPFLGSGTTCYCAKKLNRKSIGIEIEEKYCEIAARRCSQEVMELNI